VGRDMLDWRFWAETLLLAIFLGCLIAAAMWVTGREKEVLALAAGLGLIKLAILVVGKED